MIPSVDGEVVDVANFDDLFGVAFEHAVDHGEPDVAQGADVVGKEKAHGLVNPAERVVIPFEVLLSMCRFHEAGAEVVNPFEAHVHEGVFSAAFYASPHDAAFFGAVGEGSGDVDEDHLRVERCERAGEVCSDVISDASVVGFAHSGRAYAGAEEAGVISGEPGEGCIEVKEVGDDQLGEFGMGRTAVRATVCDEHPLDHRVFEAFEEDPLADHSGCASDDDFQTHSCRLPDQP